VSFRTERWVQNGISFTKQERRDATGGQGTEECEEELRVICRHIYKSAAIKIGFPIYKFPNKSRLVVFDAARREAVDEFRFADDYFFRWPESQILDFNIPQPLPGYQYAIRWELPDGPASALTDAEQGFVDEIARRLLGLRAGVPAAAGFRDALDRCRRTFLQLTGAGGPDEAAAAVYVYDRQKSGLVCVASTSARVETNWQRYFFKPGRGVTGTAYKKRAVEIFISGQSEPGTFEILPGEDCAVLPKLVVCVPLFFHGYRDRAMAVISFEAKEPSPELLRFCQQPDAAERISKEFESWYEAGLAHAIGAEPTGSFWSPLVTSVPAT
jgi:hypothetical protein